MVKQCEVCGATFTTIPSRVRIGKGKYCSAECGHKAKRTISVHHCETCGREYFPVSKDAKVGSRNCSWECRKKAWEIRKNSPEHIAKRFWAKVDKTGDCWLWKASKSKIDNGYGQFVMQDKHHNAQRVAYILTYGPIPDELMVCHSCDNPPCCNPDHLFLGTNTDNLQDMVAKGRGWAQQAGNMRRGADSPMAKLTADQVAAIRAAYANKSMNGAQLARMYGIAESTIYPILKGKRY